MLLELRDVWYRYPGMDQHALKGVSLALQAGEIKVIIGPNGAGKTTLLMVAAGLLTPVRGEVLFSGKPLRNMLPSVRRHIGVLFQNPDAMLFNPTVLDEISYVPRQLASPRRALEMALDTARLIGLHEELLGRPIHTLSYGEKKLVAWAAILSYRPRLLLLDEPFANLHPRLVEKLRNIVVNHARLGGGIIIASHEAERLRGLADELVFLENGVVRLAEKPSAPMPREAVDGL